LRHLRLESAVFKFFSLLNDIVDDLLLSLLVGFSMKTLMNGDAFIGL